MLRKVLLSFGLTPREADVAALVAKGFSNKEVGNQLFVSEKTIKFHLTKVYKKTGLNSRGKIIFWSLPHLGWVAPEPTIESKPIPIMITELDALKTMILPGRDSKRFLSNED